MKTKIGLQLYSLRQQCAANLEAVFKALATVGYDGVELCSLYGRKAADLKQLLAKYGLKAIGTHTSVETLQEGLDDLIRDSTTLGCAYVTLAYYHAAQKEGWLRLAALLERTGEKLREYGLRLLYHNHEHEFYPMVDGEKPMEILLENTTPQNLALEVDCYWVKYAGGDPEQFLCDHLGRVCTVHLKDMAKTARKTTEVGTGIINYAGISRLCAAAGLAWVIIEQDEIEIDLFTSVKISLENVRKLPWR